MAIAALVVAVVAVLVSGWAAWTSYANARRSRRAAVYAQRGDIRRIVEQADEYNFTIGNGGPALARQIRVWMSSHRATAAAPDDAVPPLRPGETCDVAITAAWILTRNGDPVTITVSWTDDAGAHEEALLEMPTAHGLN